MNKRQIVLDTETTGMNFHGPHYEGHCIIEIGAIEMINRQYTGNNFHTYIKPRRKVDPKAFTVHGISDNFLEDKPTFRKIAKSFFNYIRDAELIIHNASFDIGFINYEFNKLSKHIININDYCQVTDSLMLARKMFPGKRNSLDALCTRYNVDRTKRVLHGALLDAQILSDIFLLMTRKQTKLSFFLNEKINNINGTSSINNQHDKNKKKLNILYANKEELISHKKYLQYMLKTSKMCLWLSGLN